MSVVIILQNCYIKAGAGIRESRKRADRGAAQAVLALKNNLTAQNAYIKALEKKLEEQGVK